MSNWISRTRTFLNEVVSETKKATFPSRDELIGTTIVILVTCVIFGSYLWIADQLISAGVVGLFGR